MHCLGASLSDAAITTTDIDAFSEPYLEHHWQVLLAFSIKKAPMNVCD